MPHLNLHTVNPYQPLGHALGKVHGAMLPACAAEGDLKMATTVFEIFAD